MSLQHAYSDAQERAPRQKKDRATRRSVERRSLLMELATPVKSRHGITRKLNEEQTDAAKYLEHDLQACWPSSGACIMDYTGAGRGGGDPLLIDGMPKDYEAVQRYNGLQGRLKEVSDQMFDILGIVARHNFESKASLATLPIQTGYATPELHKASVEGELRQFLNVVYRYYEPLVSRGRRRVIQEGDAVSIDDKRKYARPG